MKFLRLITYSILGFAIGNIIGNCAKSHAQTISNELVHLNSLNTVTLRGEVTQDSITQLEVDLNAAVATRNGKKYPIYLAVDSPGGDLVEGLSFIEHAKVIPNIRTITIFAASMASGIVEGLPGERLLTGNGVLMFHRAQGSFSGFFEIGEVESRLKMAKEIMLGMEEANASRMKLSLTEYKKRVMIEYWLVANKAILSNAADKVIDVVCSQELVDTRKTVTVEGFLGNADFTFSGCPTIRGPIKTEKKQGVLSI